MATYHVYGIGNALVDAEFTVEDHFLEKMKIDKGLMTLVDENRQAEILEELSQAKRACGGSAANSMIAVSQFGGKAYYACKVADDEMGEFYMQNLLENGVQSNHTAEREAGVTGKCLVLVTPDAQRTMNTFLGITATFSYDQISESDLRESEYLYIEGYLVASPTGKEAAVKAREFAQEHGVKTAITLSDPNMTQHFGDGLREMIGSRVDMLFCNEDEAKSFCQTDSLDQAREALKEVATAFAITRGSDGALIYDGSQFIEVGSPQVKAVDSNGAGDMFAGAFLSQITQGKSYQQAGELACKAAAKVVSQFGPRISAEEAKALV
jgi:sugar/nucleoside kinase (ribokinase family)